jgi:hypothetical protein
MNLYISAIFTIIFILSSNLNAADLSPCSATLETRIQKGIANRTYWGKIDHNKKELYLLYWPGEEITCKKLYGGLTAECTYRDFSKYLDRGIEDKCKLPATVYHMLREKHQEEQYKSNQ